MKRLRNYCIEAVCLCVCLSVCRSVCPSAMTLKWHNIVNSQSTAIQLYRIGWLVCWSLTSLCHSNGHIETMPAREINPFTALTRIRSQFLRTQWSTRNHQRVDKTTRQTAQPSGLAQLYWRVDIPRCTLVLKFDTLRALEQLHSWRHLLHFKDIYPPNLWNAISP